MDRLILDILFARTRNVSGSWSTARQLARVKAPACPGAVSFTLP